MAGNEAKQMSQGMKVFDLFAELGIDASRLPKDVADSLIALEPLRKSVADMQGMLRQMGSALNPDALGAALDQINAKSKNAGEAIQTLYNALQSRVGTGALAELPRSMVPTGQQDTVHQAMANAELQRAKTKESVLRQMFEERMEEQRREQKGVEADAERFFRSQMEYNDRLGQSTKRRYEDESMYYRRESEIQSIRNRNARESAGLSGMGRFDTLFKSFSSLQLGGRMLGLEIPFEVTSLLSQSPQIAATVAKAFPVFLGLSFLDIMNQLSNKLVEVTDKWAGFGEESRKAWQEAFVGAEKAKLKLIDFNERMRMIEAGKHGRFDEDRQARTGVALGETIADVEAQLKAQVELRKLYDENVQLLKQPAGKSGVGYFGISGPMAGRVQELRTSRETVETQTAKRDEVVATIIALHDKLSDLRARSLENELRTVTDIEKKRRDRVHELPWRMPWFMGQTPEEAFAASIGGANVNNPMASVVPRRRLRTGVERSAPDLSSGVNLGTPTIATSRVMSSGAGMTFAPVYSPTFNINGVLTDVEQFIRNRVEPKIAEDLDQNARGLADFFVKSLKRHGVVTNG